MRLVRVEPAGRGAFSLVFQGAGREQAWRLENATVTEFLALLLQGQMRRGRQITLPNAEITLEPPQHGQGDPSVCLAVGALDVCVPMDRAGRRALKADIERSLKD